MKLNILVSWIEMICGPKPTTVPTGDGYVRKAIKEGVS